MPAYTRGKKRDQIRFVQVNPQLYYGFATKDLAAITGISAADLSALGHLATVPSTAIACFGANSPKPPRVSKRLAGATATTQGSVGTFCAYNRLAAAKSAGWSLAKDGREVGLRTSGKTITAIVPISDGGVLYAFNMNSADFASYGAELGLQSAASITSALETNRLVFGSTYPKPGRASKELTPGVHVTAFYDPAKKADLQQAASGWRVQNSARLFEAPSAPTTPTVP